MQVALKVDVDTHVGLAEGVPRLLDLFQRTSLAASFFVSFGPDNSGKAIRRIGQAGFLRKMWRTNPFRLYGLRTLLSGTLFPPRFIPEGNAGILRSVVEQGHELGIHGYDHVYWQDHIADLQAEEAESQLDRAVRAFRELLGTEPKSTAAPGWRCSSASLAVQERLGFAYASDVRGESPFFPVLRGHVFRTLQIPTTMPTLDELLGREKDPVACLLSSLSDRLNVFTLHAEVEGRAHWKLFESFLGELIDGGARFVRLREIAETIASNGKQPVPRGEVRRGLFPGRSGWVSCQILDGM